MPLRLDTDTPEGLTSLQSRSGEGETARGGKGNKGEIMSRLNKVMERKWQEKILMLKKIKEEGAKRQLVTKESLSMHME